MPVFVQVLILALSVTFLTEFTSNVATANVLTPLAASVAVCAGQNPLLLMVTTTLSCSLAFMLPSATPPNAIAYSTGRMQFKSMLRVGLFLNIVAVSTVTLFMMLLAPLVFDIEFGVAPQWAGNCTVAQSS